MDKDRKKADLPIIVGAILVVLFLVALGIYVGSYYKLGGVGGVTLATGEPITVRVYDAKWKAGLFAPAAKLESLVRSRRVLIEFSDTWQPYEVWEEDR